MPAYNWYIDLNSVKQNLHNGHIIWFIVGLVLKVAPRCCVVLVHAIYSVPYRFKNTSGTRVSMLI